MADIVENVLKEQAEKEAKYKTTEVQKDIDLVIDEGNLLTCDPNPLDLKQLRKTKEEYLQSLARDNTQLLINKIWKLPTERVEDVVVAQLPAPNTPLPREKPVPKARPPTKWEQYAKTKGIQNKKRSRMVWDEPSQSYKPRWGYKRSNDNTKDWVIEVPQNADPYEDQFAKRKDAKRERVAKNELQRLRNIARSTKSGKVPGVGLTPTDNPSKDYLGKALAVAKKSTASIGKFTDSLPKEGPSKFTGKKRKYEDNHGDMKKEIGRQMNILNNLGKGPIVDTNKAANLHNKQWEDNRAKRRREDPDFGKKKLTGKRSKHGKQGQHYKNARGKPAGGKGFGGKNRGGKR